MTSIQTTPTTCTNASLRCSAAASTATSLYEAISTAYREALEQLGVPLPDLVVVFVSAKYGEEIRSAMESLNEIAPARYLLGTTAEAVLANNDEYESEPAISIWMASLPNAEITPLTLEYSQTADGGTFLGWPDDLVWPTDATMLLLADPFSFPVDGLIARLGEDRPGLPILGGMASGGNQPGSNTLVINGETYDSGAVGIILGGGVRVRPVVSQGCRPIGTPLVVTKAEDNMLVELGGRPAFVQLRAVYETLDDHDKQLVKSSLHVGRVASEYQDHFEPGDFLVRNVVGADPETGVVAVGDLIRTGQTVQFHVRDAHTAHEDLQALLTRQTTKPPAGALVFTCNGRGRRLFSTPSHDASCLQQLLGPLPVAGFFAQGEIGPIGNTNCLHGFTASIALFEAAE